MIFQLYVKHMNQKGTYLANIKMFVLLVDKAFRRSSQVADYIISRTKSKGQRVSTEFLHTIFWGVDLKSS